MYRKKAVEDAGGYRHCPWFEDYDLWTRMLMNGSEGYNLQEPLLYMRAGDGMYSRRGGLEYARKAVVFRYRLMRKGFSRPTDFIISAAGQICVSLMPNQLRKNSIRKRFGNRREKDVSGNRRTVKATAEKKIWRWPYISVNSVKNTG